MDYKEIKCVNEYPKDDRTYQCSRFLGSIEAEKELSVIFHCQRCKILWRVQQSVQDIVLMDRVEKKHIKYKDNEIRIEWQEQ